MSSKIAPEEVDANFSAATYASSQQPLTWASSLNFAAQNFNHQLQI